MRLSAPKDVHVISNRFEKKDGTAYDTDGGYNRRSGIQWGDTNNSRRLLWNVDNNTGNAASYNNGLTASEKGESHSQYKNGLQLKKC
uniref:Uncharacterized protein n=1 Tax=Romanomermis culicivorax TaxID=13658 RepID=A0A915K5S1_ROMCU